MPTYTAHATTTGGRNGHVESSDGLLKAELSVPKDIGGPGRAGATNPEQFFAAGYSACFGGAVDYAAKLEKVHAGPVTVTADVTLHASDAGFSRCISRRMSTASTRRRSRSWYTRRTTTSARIPRRPGTTSRSRSKWCDAWRRRRVTPAPAPRTGAR